MAIPASKVLSFLQHSTYHRKKDMFRLKDTSSFYLRFLNRLSSKLTWPLANDNITGLTENPSLVKKPVQVLTKKNPSNPAATFNEGIIPTVRLSLWVMMQNRVPSTALTTNPLIVIWSFHSGTRSDSSSKGFEIPADELSVPMVEIFLLFLLSSIKFESDLNLGRY
ncbi:hypothetical protein G2W53_040854 [Senna tora]|uniref:Uncharacterized protein n=1 Tax=Senna tora TaxID=362788 RepID=A0A834SDY3_9FABA|nr:hypothetical protein G2W53_040854 [Senna tora]